MYLIQCDAISNSTIEYTFLIFSAVSFSSEFAEISSLVLFGAGGQCGDKLSAITSLPDRKVSSANWLCVHYILVILLHLSSVGEIIVEHEFQFRRSWLDAISRSLLLPRAFRSFGWPTIICMLLAFLRFNFYFREWDWCWAKKVIRNVSSTFLWRLCDKYQFRRKSNFQFPLHFVFGDVRTERTLSILRPLPICCDANPPNEFSMYFAMRSGMLKT